MPYKWLTKTLFSVFCSMRATVNKRAVSAILLLNNSPKPISAYPLLAIMKLAGLMFWMHFCLHHLCFTLVCCDVCSQHKGEWEAAIIINKILPKYADFAKETKMYIQLMKSLGLIRKARKRFQVLHWPRKVKLTFPWSLSGLFKGLTTNH